MFERVRQQNVRLAMVRIDVNDSLEPHNAVHIPFGFEFQSGDGHETGEIVGRSIEQTHVGLTSGGDVFLHRRGLSFSAFVLCEIAVALPQPPIGFRMGRVQRQRRVEEKQRLSQVRCS